VASGGNGGGAFEGLAATAMRFFGNGGSTIGKPAPAASVEATVTKALSKDKETPSKS
jgi:hypothetical protein